MSEAYEAFLARKSILDPSTGLIPSASLPGAMFLFQRDITAWALRRGRAAVFAGTGLGKSFMELAWADAIYRETGRDVLHLAPLAVTAQLVREGARFGIGSTHCRTGADVRPGDNITNFQKLDHFDLSSFGGVILDESSILKNVDGHYRTRLIEQCQQVPFRLAATATPAPNDYMELGNHAEFLGVMSYTDMLATFFIHDGGDTQKWRLKGHAEAEFWRWVSSWAVMLRKPSDLGYSDDGYILPTLHRHQHVVESEFEPPGDGSLFAMPAVTLSERIKARRDTVHQRVAKAAEITPSGEPVCWWCNLNAESEMLAKAINAVELRGSDSEDDKERIILDFCEGRIQRLVTKPAIMSFGVNAQVCAWTGFVGLNDSFEQVYQATRRFWRFGQTREVHAHFISADTEGATVSNIQRKERDADRMMAAMIMHTADLTSQAVRGQVRDKPTYDPQETMRIPTWMETAA